MYLELISEKGEFYKANMHCHTCISDGENSPEEIKAMYKAAGYSAVCFTDHEVLIAHKELCDSEFVALHGYEVAIKQDLTQHSGLFMKVFHFNMIAKSQDTVRVPMFFADNPSSPGNSREWMDKCAVYDEKIDKTVYDLKWINNYLGRISDGGYLITYNHPQWSLQSWDEYIRLEHLHAIEVINGHCTPMNDNTSIHFEAMLRFGKHVIPVAGDDHHKTADSLNAWTMIKAPELSYDALMKSYEDGECYASEGPEIYRLVLKNGKIVINTSAVSQINLLSEGRYVQVQKSTTDDCNGAEFDYCPEKFGKYFRIELIDVNGKRAFTRAYFTDDISKKLE